MRYDETNHLLYGPPERREDTTLYGRPAVKITNSEDFTEFTHVNGIWWHEAPLPPRRHECQAWTSGWLGFKQVQRCACGAARSPDWGHPVIWVGKNERRKDDDPEPATKDNRPTKNRKRGLLSWLTKRS